jgi:hypothetical protein
VHPLPAKDPFDATIEVLVRREADAIRSGRWTLDESETTLRAATAERSSLLADLRRGGNVALRIVSDPALGAAQPTFQFAVDGFAAVEAHLDCLRVGSTAPARDPFAAVAPAGPGVGVVTREPPTSGSAAPEAPAADPWRVHPITGLYTYDSTLAEFEPLPAPFTVDGVFDTGADFVMLVGDAPAELLRGLSYSCASTGGANGVIATVASPALIEDEFAYLVLFEAGSEIGEVELSWAHEAEGVREAIVEYDEDEVGLYLALMLYGALDAVLLAESGDVIDFWRIEPRGFATAIDGLGCALR